MRDSIYRITLDIYNTSTQVQITARKDDSARRIFATFTEHGKPFSVPFGTRAVMSIKKPDGTSVLNDCDIRHDGTVIFDFTDFVTNVEGRLYCVLSLKDEDDSLIASPRFMIVVMASSYDAGQIMGDDIRKLIDKTNDMPRTYGSAVDLMAATNLQKGQMCATRGRWYENDGGARTYRVTDAAGAAMPNGTQNPLAIALENGLYALPVITDKVTALDIGLRRGVLRPEDQTSEDDNLTKTALAYYADGAIPAENSRLLQTYIDRLPPFGADDTLANKDTTDPARDYWGGTRQRMTDVFFPEGTWFFRDPIVVDKPITFEGTYKSNDHLFTYNHSDYSSTRLMFCARELTVSTGGTNLYPYVGSGCCVKEQLEEKRGDEEYELGNSSKQESTYVETALFFAASSGVSFLHLEIGALSAFEFHIAPRCEGHWGARPGDKDPSGQVPSGEAGKRGDAYNAFHLTRRLKGVCGIICRAPNRNTAGRILVTAAGRIDYAKRSDGGDNTTVYWINAEHCCFRGFSGTAIGIGDVSKVSECEFRQNYVGIRLEAPDVWINRVYIERGLIGINTNSHTCFVYSSYIDVMAGFAVASKLTDRSFRKRHVVKPTDAETEAAGDYSYCVHTNYEVSGSLLGLFDVCADYCIMGAYASLKACNNVDMRGRITHSGILYCADTVIEDKGAFGKLRNYLKAKDAYENPNRSATATWNESAGTWTGEASDDTSINFSGFCSTYAAMINRYERWTTAQIQLEPIKSSFYIDSMPIENILNEDTTVDNDAYETILETFIAYLEQREAAESNTPDEQKTLHVENEDETGISRYRQSDVITLYDAFIADRTTTSDSLNALCMKNRTENFNRMIGMSSVNIAYMHTVNANVAIAPRVCKGANYTEDGKTKFNYVIAPIYAYHYINGFDCVIRGVMIADRTSSVKNRLEPVYFHGYNDNAFSVPINADTDRKNMKIATTRSVPESGWDATQTAYGTVDTDTGTQTLNLVASLSHKPTGEPAIKIYGFANLSENTDVQYNFPARTDTSIPDYKPFASWYNGVNKANVLAFAIIAANQYPPVGKVDAEHPISVRRGEVIGSLILNTNSNSIIIHPQESYYGEIMPIVF